MPNGTDLSKDIHTIRSEMLKEVDKKVNEQFDRAKDLLKLLIGTALKILGGTLALALFVATLFGIKTYRDTNILIEDIIKKKVESHLKNDSPSEIYYNRIEELYTKTLIDYIILQSKRKYRDRYYRVSMDSSESNRVLSIIKNPETKMDLFRDAAKAIEVGTSRDHWDHIASQIIKVINDQERGVAWMKSSPEKVELLVSILTNNSNSTVMKGLLNKISDETVNDRVRIAAIKYAGEVGDLLAVPSIEKVLEKESPVLKEHALLAIARLNPNSNYLNQYIEQLLQIEKLNENGIRRILEIIEMLLRSTRIYFGILAPPDPDYEHRMDLSKKLFIKFINSGYVFGLSKFDNDLKIYISEGRYSKAQHLEGGLIEGGYPIETSLFDSLSPWNTLFRRIFEDLATSGKLNVLADFVNAISVEDWGEKVGFIKLELEDKSGVIIEDGTIVDFKIAPWGATLQSLKIDTQRLVVIEWMDITGVRKRGIINKIISPDKIAFYFETKS